MRKRPAACALQCPGLRRCTGRQQKLSVKLDPWRWRGQGGKGLCERSCRVGAPRRRAGADAARNGRWLTLQVANHAAAARKSRSELCIHQRLDSRWQPQKICSRGGVGAHRERVRAGCGGRTGSEHSAGDGERLTRQLPRPLPGTESSARLAKLGVKPRKNDKRPKASLLRGRTAPAGLARRA